MTFFILYLSGNFLTHAPHPSHRISKTLPFFPYRPKRAVWVHPPSHVFCHLPPEPSLSSYGVFNSKGQRQVWYVHICVYEHGTIRGKGAGKCRRYAGFSCSPLSPVTARIIPFSPLLRGAPGVPPSPFSLSRLPDRCPPQRIS